VPRMLFFGSINRIFSESLAAAEVETPIGWARPPSNNDVGLIDSGIFKRFCCICLRRATDDRLLPKAANRSSAIKSYIWPAYGAPPLIFAGLP